LFNALVGRDAAIVSPREGTTRDIVEAETQIAGYAVTLADTAGLRFSDDEIEAEGVRRARRWAEAANWRLLLVPPDEVEVSEEQAPLLKPGDLLVLTKSDQAGRSDPRKLLEFARLRGLTSVGTSVLGVDGMTNIREAMSTHIVAELSGADTPATTRMRHVHAVQQARTALAQGLSVLEREPEKAADDIQVAISALRSVVGDVDREAVLDQVFSSFCIGK
jgi:tRNA modification GTPase